MKSDLDLLQEILLTFGEAHDLIAKSSLPKEEYNPISGLLAKGKMDLFEFYNRVKSKDGV